MTAQQKAWERETQRERERPCVPSGAYSHISLLTNQRRKHWAAMPDVTERSTTHTDLPAACWRETSPSFCQSWAEAEGEGASERPATMGPRQHSLPRLCNRTLKPPTAAPPPPVRCWSPASTSQWRAAVSERWYMDGCQFVMYTELKVKQSQLPCIKRHLWEGCKVELLLKQCSLQRLTFVLLMNSIVLYWRIQTLTPPLNISSSHIFIEGGLNIRNTS